MTRARSPLLPSLTALLLLSACSTAPSTTHLAKSESGSLTARASEPGLVLWITVDQFGTNLLERYAQHLPGSALERLIDEGLWYSEASYSHAITETAPGHATLFTGAPPRVHGIVGNEWFDTERLRVVTSVTDEDSPLIGPGLQLVETPSSSGRSPKQLRVPTVGDALRLHTKGQSQVLAISVKDRAAILPAGHSGKAYWLGPESYITSRYYHEQVPPWLLDFARSGGAAQYAKAPWELALPPERYLSSETPKQYAPEPMGPGFPHATTDLLSFLRFSPAGDRATLDLAKSAILSEGLGKGETTDLLAISLSSTDYIGHVYGPESLEAEDNFIRLNQVLGEFLSFVEEELGRERLLVVLSADHGGCETAETLKRLGLRGQRLSPTQIAAAARQALQERYGHDEFFSAVVSPSVIFDRAKIAERGEDPKAVIEAVRVALSTLEGIHSVYSADTLSGETALERRVRESWFEGRSGDLYIVTDPHTLLLQEELLGATHGSPWSYDSRVPVLLWGDDLPSGRVTRPVSVTSLAPTVARLLGITPPAGASRELLSEAWEVSSHSRHSD